MDISCPLAKHKICSSKSLTDFFLNLVGAKLPSPFGKIKSCGCLVYVRWRVFLFSLAYFLIFSGHNLL